MSAINDQIMSEMKDAMRSKNKPRLETLRMLKAALQTDLSQGEQTEEQALAILNKQLKQRNEAAKMYSDGDRPELAEKESAEAEVIKEFLPKQLSEDEIKEIVNNAFDNGATTMPAMMQVVMPQTKGLADGKLVSQIVKARLG